MNNGCSPYCAKAPFAAELMFEKVNSFSPGDVINTSSLSSWQSTFGFSVSLSSSLSTHLKSLCNSTLAIQQSVSYRGSPWWESHGKYSAPHQIGGSSGFAHHLRHCSGTGSKGEQQFLTLPSRVLVVRPPPSRGQLKPGLESPLNPSKKICAQLEVV